MVVTTKSKKYLTAIAEDEMVCRILEGMTGTKRPQDATALQALATADVETVRAARRAARSVMEYWRECIENLQATN